MQYFSSTIPSNVIVYFVYTLVPMLSCYLVCLHIHITIQPYGGCLDITRYNPPHRGSADASIRVCECWCFKMHSLDVIPLFLFVPGDIHMIEHYASFPASQFLISIQLPLKGTEARTMVVTRGVHRENREPSLLLPSITANPPSAFATIDSRLGFHRGVTAHDGDARRSWGRQELHCFPRRWWVGC